jgi:hypothetical protein
MATNYPGSLDTGTEQPSPLSSTEMDDAGFEHDVVHTNHSGAIIALETKVGTGSSTAVANSVLAGTGAGTSAWTTGTLANDISGNAATATTATTATSATTATTATNLSGGSVSATTVTATGQLVLDNNIASPSNYYNGLQAEVRATSGTAGIGLHRSGYSHVGIYTDAQNVLKFDMNSGSVTLNHNTGTIWGSGNDGSGSGLDADTLDGVQGSAYLRSDTSDTLSGALTVTGNTTAQGDLYVGKNGGSDSRIYFYDDNSNAWRLFMWDDSQNSFYTDQTIRAAQLLWTTTDDGLGPVTGQYGSVQTRGTGAGNWEGYSINGQQVFMGNGTETCGIYNDVDNQWLLYFDADTYTQLYDSDGIVAFGANNATTTGGGSGGNGYVGISNECGGFSGTTCVVSTTTVAGVTMKRLGFSASSYEFKSGIEDLAMSDEAFMSLRPITFHPNDQYVDSTGEVTEIVGGHTIVPDQTEAGETNGLMPLRRAGFGLEDLYGRDDTMILASEFSPDPMAMVALLTQKLQETMTRVAALEAA